MWKNARNVDIHGGSFINVEGDINYNAGWKVCLQCAFVQSLSMILDTATWTFVKHLVSCHQKSVFWNLGILKASKVRLLVNAPFSLSNLIRSSSSELLYHKIIRWLSPLQFRQRQRDIFARRVEGTGEWLLDSEEYKAWQSGSTAGVLWCPGKRRWPENQYHDV